MMLLKSTDLTEVRNGTACGTLLSTLPNIMAEDLARTVLLAIVGATVSFSLTMGLKWTSALWKKRKRRNH